MRWLREKVELSLAQVGRHIAWRVQAWTKPSSMKRAAKTLVIRR